jgi:putative PIN family toxin of toxin-antitoxin system
MKVVIDTNVLLRSIPKISPFRPIFTHIISGQIQVCVSESILQEYLEVISSKTSDSIGKNVIELFLSLQNVNLIEVYFQWGLIIQDWDDNKFVDCAIASNADLIVTDDKHFDVLSQSIFPKVLCIDSESFLRLISSPGQ